MYTKPINKQDLAITSGIDGGYDITHIYGDGTPKLRASVENYNTWQEAVYALDNDTWTLETE